MVIFGDDVGKHEDFPCPARDRPFPPLPVTAAGQFSSNIFIAVRGIPGCNFFFALL